MESNNNNDDQQKRSAIRNKSQTSLKINTNNPGLKHYTNIKPKSTEKHLPPIMTITTNNFNKRLNLFYQNTNYNNKFNQKQNDLESLKKEISYNKTEIQNKIKEINELKINIKKQEEDNKNHKALIAKVLGIPLDKPFSKNELIEVIENCEPNEEAKNALKEAYEIIKLKLEINDKKKIINNKKIQIERLTKNANTKVINELIDEYNTKCGHKTELIKTIKKMENSVKKNENIVKDLEKEYLSQKEKNNKISEALSETQKILKEYDDEKNTIEKEINEIYEKTRKLQEKITFMKNKSRTENEDETIKLKQKQLDDINQYLLERDDIKKNLEEKRNNLKNLENKKKEQEKQIGDLKQENAELAKKIEEYNAEKNKLVKKANSEPKENLQKIKELEEELKKLQEENEKYKGSNININVNNSNNNEDENKGMKHYKAGQVSESEKEELALKKNKEIIDKNNIEKDNMNQQINHLKTLIEDVDKKINDNKVLINNMEKLLNRHMEQNGKNEAGTNQEKNTEGEEK